MPTATEEIQNFAELLSAFDKRLIKYSGRPLIGPGENYGSVMLAVDVTVTDANKNANEGKEEELSLVAKLCPPNEFIQELFDTQNTFRKEALFYSDFVPRLQKFQQEQGMSSVMDFYPKYIASRLSLKPHSLTVDSHAVLLLANIKSLGFSLADRMTGMDLPTASLVVRNLAIFHAVPLAYRLTHPKLFQQHFQPHLNGHPTFSTMSEAFRDQLVNQAVQFVENSDGKALAGRFKAALTESGDFYIKKTMPDGGSFATITHNDFWTNNTMVLMDEDEKPVKNAMLDFQMIDYGNPCNDLVFFLFTSVDYKALEHYEELVELYFTTFIDTLKQLDCETSIYTREAFDEQMTIAAKYSQLFHVVIMFKPILKNKSDAVALGEINEDVFTSMAGLGEVYFKKLSSTVREFDRRNWL